MDKTKILQFELLIALLLVISCSTNKKKSVSSTEKPDWVNAPEASCPKEYICAVGMGSGLNTSYADARAEIAKSFKASIKSKHVSSLSSQDYKISESTFDEVEESTDEVISGIKIHESWEGKDDYYSYARLNRAKVGKLIKVEIKPIDDEIDQLYKNKSFASIVKLIPLFQKRELLAARYNFVTNKSFNSRYNFDRLARLVNELKKNYRLRITSSKNAPKALVSKVKGYFGKNGVKLVSDNSFSHKLDLKFYSNKQFLKVKGFEKYKFVFELTAQKKASAKSSVISFKEDIIARGFDDCLNKALLKVDNFIEEKVYKLGI